MTRYRSPAMKSLGRCRCEEPDRTVDRDGVPYCNLCGDLLPEQLEDAVPLLIKAVEQLTDHLSARSEGGALVPRLVPRLALSKAEAAEALGGVSMDYFEEHVQPELNVVRRGRKVIVPRSEIERWLTENASRTLL